MAFIRAVLLIIAAVASGDAVISFAAHLESDSYVYLLVAVCALGGFFLIDHLEEESRRRMSAYRDEVWRRREAGR